MKRPPTYCHHKASGQAVIRVYGKDIYLGLFNSPESRERYEKALETWRVGESARLDGMLNFGEINSYLQLRVASHIDAWEVATLNRGVNERAAASYAAYVKKIILVILNSPLTFDRINHMCSRDRSFRINSEIRDATFSVFIPQNISMAMDRLRQARNGRSSLQHHLNAVIDFLCWCHETGVIEESMPAILVFRFAYKRHPIRAENRKSKRNRLAETASAIRREFSNLQSL